MDVHKVSLQFQKFIAKAADEISSSDLSYVLGLDCIVLLMNKILLNEPFTKWPLLERRYSVYHGLLKPNRIYETFELSMKGIHPSRPSVRAWHKKFYGNRDSVR